MRKYLFLALRIVFYTAVVPLELLVVPLLVEWWLRYRQKKAQLLISQGDKIS